MEAILQLRFPLPSKYAKLTTRLATKLLQTSPPSPWLPQLPSPKASCYPQPLIPAMSYELCAACSAVQAVGEGTEGQTRLLQGVSPLPTPGFCLWAQMCPSEAWAKELENRPHRSQRAKPHPQSLHLSVGPAAPFPAQLFWDNGGSR